MRIIFEAADAETARLLLAKVVTNFEDANSVLVLPVPYRKQLRTTNGIERLNEEVSHRERVIHISPNRESVLRLLGAVLMEQDEAWTTGHRYFDMHLHWRWRAEVETEQVLTIGSVTTDRRAMSPAAS